MKIQILSGSGVGETKNASFDSALKDIGLHDYNIVSLSSVIPEGAEIVQKDSHNGTYSTGTTVASVMARNTSGHIGNTVSAGLGWCKSDDGGVFVEETESSTSLCSDLIDLSLDECISNRPNKEWHEKMKKIEATEVERRYTTVVVVALYGEIDIGYQS